MISVDSPQGAPGVDVWAIRLDAPVAAIRAFRSLISPEEMSRADRFAQAHLKASYEVSHGVLRVLLSPYLKRGPRDVEFTFGRAGKPALRGDSRLRFNMSHSGSLAAYAFTLDCEIGIDIEEVCIMPDLEPIAQRYFCGAEAGQLLSIPDEKLRREAFFRCWTRKESYIKAIGAGLSVPLDGFQVTFSPDSAARIVHIGHDAGAASAWTLQHLEPAPGYVGALAYRAPARQVELHPLQQAQEILDLLSS
jgi:4'-phosphopantetheinyl transferase